MKKETEQSVELMFFKRILNRKFLVKNQDIMDETKERKQTPIRIDYQGVPEYALYRFDLENFDFLPFFNKAHGAELPVEEKAPRFLCSFCDYILLAVLNNRIYILLIELKSGDRDGYLQQLQAGSLLMNYVKESALRICKDNNVKFDPNRIETRMILITPYNRPPVKVSKGFYLENGVRVCSGNYLRVSNVCKF